MIPRLVEEFDEDGTLDRWKPRGVGVGPVTVQPGSDLGSGASGEIGSGLFGIPGGKIQVVTIHVITGLEQCIYICYHEL